MHNKSPWLIFLIIFLFQVLATLSAPASIAAVPGNNSISSTTTTTGGKTEPLKNNNPTSPVVKTNSLPDHQKYGATLLNETLLPFLKNCSKSAQVENHSKKQILLCNAYLDAVETLNHSSSKQFQTPESVLTVLKRVEKDSDEFCRRLNATLPKEAKYRKNIDNFSGLMSHFITCSLTCFDANNPDNLQPQIRPICQLITALYEEAAQNNDKQLTPDGGIPGKSPIVASYNANSQPDVTADTRPKVPNEIKPHSTTVDEQPNHPNPITTKQDNSTSHALNDPKIELQKPIELEKTKTPAKSALSGTTTTNVEYQPDQGPPAAAGVDQPVIPDQDIPKLPDAFGGGEEDYTNSEMPPMVNNNNNEPDPDDDDDDVQETHPGDNHIVRRPVETPKDPFIDEESSSFFSYFMFILVLVMAAYVFYHNRRFILALLLEGRRRGGDYGAGGRRKHTAAYRKLDSNLEEAIASPKGTTTRSQPIIY